MALLPFVDERRLRAALEEVYPDLTPEESKNWGCFVKELGCFVKELGCFVRELGCLVKELGCFVATYVFHPK